MKKLITVSFVAILLVIFGVVYYNRVDVSASKSVVSLQVKSNRSYDIPAGTTYSWINAMPVMTDDVNFQWVNGAPYIIMTATHPTPSMSNTPNTLALGTVNSSTAYYAKGSAPANPVIDANCTFTITNDGTITEKIQIQCTDFTDYALGASADATHVKMTAYYSGQNPASGVVVNGTAQDFIPTIAASGTKAWDFKLDTITANGNGNVQTATITLTAATP
jgi:hypothetical protein